MGFRFGDRLGGSQAGFAAPSTADRPPLLVHVFPGFGIGGAQVRFAAIANHFGGAFRHLLVSLDGDLRCRERLHPQLDVAFPNVSAAKNSTATNAWRFRRLLRGWRPDALLTYNWGAIEFALANLPALTRHLHVVDGFGSEEQSRQLPRRVWLRRLALRRGSVVVPSAALVRLASDVWRLPAGVVRLVPNGIDVDCFDNGSLPCKAPDGEPVIGTVAALRAEKNLGRLLRAFARLPTGRLVVVGDGAERDGLMTLAGSLGLEGRVHFAGHHADTAGFYRRFDVFALSSDTEQMPLSVIEAMASGLPVAATDVGDVRGMLSDANAPFVTGRDAAALAAALAALIADPMLRRRVGLANRTKARASFGQAAMFAAHGALWREAASGSC